MPRPCRHTVGLGYSRASTQNGQTDCFYSPRQLELPFYQFTQPSVSVSPCSVNSLDFFDSFSVRLLRGQGPQNATYGDRDSSPGDLPTARAGDPTGPSPAARRPPQWLSTTTRRARPN